MRSQRLLPVAISASLLFSVVPQTPFVAQAAPSDNKTTAVTISVDGVSSDLTRSWTDLELARTAAFGGGGPLDVSGVGERANDLTTMFTTKSSGINSNALMRNMAQGGVEEITCTDLSKAYYQRSQITISNLSTDETKRVWAFYDGNVGSGDNIKGGAHFNDNGSGVENSRITSTGSLPTLCDGSTPYVKESDDSAATAGTLRLGASRTTAGVYQDLADSADSVSFNVYVPMDAISSDAVRIQLALGFVIDFTDITLDPIDGSTLNDATKDVAIETSIYSKPWWQTPQGEGEPDHDEVHQILPACSSPAANAAPCVIQADTGVFNTDGTIRLDSGVSTGTSVALTWLGDADNFEARLDLAPIEPISNNGFAIESGKVSRISVSWPTDGTHFGSSFGEGSGKIDMNLAFANTPVLVDPSADGSSANKWSVLTDANRVITTLNGVARETSHGISRDTWWQQCEVSIDEAGTVTSNKCGAEMLGSVTATEMIFTTVPTSLVMQVSPNSAPLAGALISTNGQGFAVGPETFSGESFQFAVAGPSVTSTGNSRSTDGFFYACVPATYLTDSFDTTAADAAGNFNGTRDGSDASTSFSTGTCGIGDTGLVGSLAEFGYSAPMFRLAPPAAPQAVAPPAVVFRPYFGPIARPLTKTPANQGEESIISGFRMDTVESVHSGDHQFKIVSNSPSELVVLVPTGIHGLIDLTLAWENEGESGTYTIPQALDIALEMEPDDIQAKSLKKLTTGSFKGFIAIYTKGYEGSKLSAKVAGKWLLVDSLDESWRGNDYSRTVRFTGAGYDIFVHLYIDGEYIRTDELTTK